MLFWLMSFIPNEIFVWVAYICWGAGLGLYVISKFLVWLPQLRLGKTPAELTGIAGLVIGAWLLGSYGTEAIWKQRVAEMEAKLQEAEAKSQEQNVKIEKVYVDRVKVVREIQVVVQEKIKEVEKIIDAKCEVEPVAIDILNKAAKNPHKPAGEKK